MNTTTAFVRFTDRACGTGKTHNLIEELNTWDGTKIYLEDHMPDAHNSLCSYFNVNMPQKIFKIKLDYEKYVLNLTEAKDWFYRYGV